MQSDEQQIRALVTNWMQATRDGDTETILDLMADDVVFLVAGQPPMVGKSAFAAAMQAQPTGERPRFEGESEIQEIQLLGDWAYMWTRLSITVTPPGGAAPMLRAGHTLSVLRKQNGKWVIARDANMLAPAAK
jgi:uncharacterized protein (TIGR02246 family)